MPDQSTPAAPPAAPPLIEALPALRRQVLAERLHRLLDGGTPRPDSRYQRRELELHVVSSYEAQEAERLYRNAQAEQQFALLRQKLEKEWYFDDLRAQSELGGTTDEFLYSYVLPVLQDPDSERDYLLLPDEFVTLKRYQNLPGEGVHDVLPLSRKERRDVRFLPLKGSQESLLSGLFAGGLGGDYTYFRRGTRVFLEYDPGTKRPSERFEKLEVQLVLRRRQADELPGPALLQAAQDFDILGRALKLAQKVVPEDKINDGNSTVQ